MSKQWKRIAVLVLLILFQTPFTRCVAATEDATASSTQAVGPSQREIEMFGKRIESVSDISISPFTFKNLIFLANLYSLGGQPIEAERVAKLGLSYAEANDPTKILSNAMTQSLIGAMVSLEEYDAAERLLLDRLADFKTPSFTDPNIRVRATSRCQPVDHNGTVPNKETHGKGTTIRKASNRYGPRKGECRKACYRLPWNRPLLV
jgi:hypothetical protein